MKDVNTHTELNHLFSQRTSGLVYFTGSWCEPCSRFSPVVKRVSDAFNNLIHTIKVDVDKFPDAVGEFNIRSVPTLLLFINGKPVEGMVGVQSYEQVSNWLMRHLLVFNPQ